MPKHNHFKINTDRVCDLFDQEKIDIEMVSSLGDLSNYWNKATDFVTTNWLKPVEALSDKQKDWLLRILDDAIEKRIKGQI